MYPLQTLRLVSKDIGLAFRPLSKTGLLRVSVVGMKSGSVWHLPFPYCLQCDTEWGHTPKGACKFGSFIFPGVCTAASAWLPQGTCTLSALEQPGVPLILGMVLAARGPRSGTLPHRMETVVTESFVYLTWEVLGIDRAEWLWKRPMCLKRRAAPLATLLEGSHIWVEKTIPGAAATLGLCPETEQVRESVRQETFLPSPALCL